MLQRILMNTVCGRAILSIAVAGVLLQMITTFSYRRMKRAAENAGKTKKQWVQILKKRFENYERFGRIRNIEAFVEHYFARKGIMGIPLGFWDRAVAFLSMASLLTGLTGAFRAYLGQAPAEEIYVFLFSGTIVSVGLSLLYTLGNAKEAKKKIIVALTDYFSNVMGQRKDTQASEKSRKIPTRDEVESLSEAAVTEEEKQILAEVLEEYFW